MSTVLIMNHEVADFNHWKPLFEAGKEMREQHGLTLNHLYQDAQNPNDVTAIFTVADVEKAKSMLSNPQLAEAMKEAGVVSAPNVRFLNAAQ